MLNSQEMLNIASRLGYAMLKYGAETYRIEDSMDRVLHALGATEIDVFVINSCFILSIKSEDGKTVSKIKRCREKEPDLYKIEKLNSLCRNVCSGDVKSEDIISIIDQIEAKKPYNFFFKWLGFTLVSVFFCAMFSGKPIDLLSALLTSIAVFPLIFFMEKNKAGLFIKNIIASASIALIATLLSYIFKDVKAATVIIGAFMNLVPGVSLTTSMRDIIAGDLIAGKNTLTEALIISLGMALGSGIVITILRLI